MRRFAAMEDDENEEDSYDYDDKGPLSRGVDSVSWLPSVEGAKGDNMPIKSTNQVSFVSSSSTYNVVIYL